MLGPARVTFQVALEQSDARVRLRNRRNSWVTDNVSARLAMGELQLYLARVKRYGFGELVFSWDERKAAANLRQHGVRFEEAATVFLDPLGRAYDDPDHSEYELRFLLVGHSLTGRILLVVHAENDDTIRIISARRATPREREDYEADA